jgi:hypothetical protein
MNIINLCPDIIKIPKSVESHKNNLTVCRELPKDYTNIKKICYISPIQDLKLKIDNFNLYTVEKLYDHELWMYFYIHNDHIDDLTFIICGYVSNICNINRVICFSYGKFIQSTNDKHTEGDIQFVSDAVSKKYHFERNMYYQMYNIYRVISDVNTEFCIKHRSDEYYVDMAEYIGIIKGSNKLITNNLFFYGSDYYISDHLFGSNTIMFKKMINNLRDILENKKIIDEHYFLHTEKVFGLSYIIDRYTQNEINTNSKEIMMNNFDIYACDRFTDYLSTTLHGGATARMFPGKHSANRGRGHQNIYMHKYRVYIKKNTGYTDTQPEGTVDDIVKSVKSNIMVINKMEDIKW